MPSDARSRLAENSADLTRLHEIHSNESGQGPGRKYHVEVLNKAAVVFVCAAWEAFCEDLVKEAVGHITNDCADPANVPPYLRTLVSDGIKKDAHNHSAWLMAGDGWRTILKTNAEYAIRRLTGAWNSPKSEQIQDLFKRALGLQDVTASWHWKKCSVATACRKLDEFVARRGEIAHRLTTTVAVAKWEGEFFFRHVGRLGDLLDADVGRLLAAVNGQSYW